MALKMIELPGRYATKRQGRELNGTGAQCPFCSKVYDEYDYETDKPLKFPEECERCGSPMDDGEDARAFSEMKAEEGQRQWARPTQAMKVEEALKVLIDAGYLPPRKE